MTAKSEKRRTSSGSLIRPDVLERRVQRALAPHHRDPGHRSNQIARPEGREGDDEERDLEAQARDADRQEVGDGEAQDEREGDDHERVPEAAPKLVPVDVRVEQEPVVLERPDGLEAAHRACPEADEHDHEDGHEEEEQEPQRPWSGPGGRGQCPAAPRAGPLLLAERLLVRRPLADDLLGLDDLLDVQPYRPVLTTGGVGHPPPSRTAERSCLPSPGTPDTGRRAPWRPGAALRRPGAA